MNHFGGPGGFLDFFEEIPLFIKIFVLVLILLFLLVILYAIIRGLVIWISNNAAEPVQRNCTVIHKRTDVWGSDSESNAHHYITFEFEDNTRIELQVSFNKYRFVSIGDQGQLSYQGTRFKEFDSIAGAKSRIRI